MSEIATVSSIPLFFISPSMRSRRERTLASALGSTMSCWGGNGKRDSFLIATSKFCLHLFHFFSLSHKNYSGSSWVLASHKAQRCLLIFWNSSYFPIIYTCTLCISFLSFCRLITFFHLTAGLLLIYLPIASREMLDIIILFFF